MSAVTALHIQQGSAPSVRHFLKWDKGGDRFMQSIELRIKDALAAEEAAVERFANNMRLILLSVFSLVALVNFQAISREANLINFCVLGFAFVYGWLMFFVLWKSKYRSWMKYLTSWVDILLVFVLLYLYSMIETASVALKHYPFMIIFPFIALTAFRFDWRLTMLTGSWAVFLYLLLFSYLYWSGSIHVLFKGYSSELFTPDVTWMGQFTKILILTGYVALVTYLTRYTRNLFYKLVHNEVAARMETEAMEDELRVAARVQEGFLPRSLPVIAGLDFDGRVLPGRYIGGDYYDFLPSGDDSLLLIVADVSGHGVSAALIMSEIRASVHLLVSMQISLDECVHRLNTLVYKSTESHHYVTCFVAEIDAKAQEIRYVNSGHPQALICCNEGIRHLGVTTTPLGMFPSVPPGGIRCESFARGSSMVVCTDGILERTNSREEEFGIDRLASFLKEHCELPARHFVQRMLHDVSSFGGDKGFEDDVTLAVVKYCVPIPIGENAQQA
jgi:serine phosphatase RsbU (regulator of sigma subunit)